MTLNGWQRLFVAYLLFIHAPFFGLFAFEAYSANWHDASTDMLSRISKNSRLMVDSGFVMFVDPCPEETLRVSLEGWERGPTALCLDLARPSPGESDLAAARDNAFKAGDGAAVAILNAELELVSARARFQAADRDQAVNALMKDLDGAHRRLVLVESAEILGWGVVWASMVGAFGWVVGWVVRGFVGDATPSPRTLTRDSGWAIARLLRRLFFR